MIKNQKDFYAGLLFLFFAGVGLFLARDLKVGTAAKMGPGYFPVVLCVLLGGLGVVTILRALIGHSERIGCFAQRKALVIVQMDGSPAALWLQPFDQRVKTARGIMVRGVLER